MEKFWKQITPSGFAWEYDALEFMKENLPDHEPYRAWANFEFIAQNGSINEVDLLVLTPKGLFHIEIKSHPGEISGNAGSWIWNPPNGRQKIFDNPRVLADRKSKKLASLLKIQQSAIKSKEKIPFINTLVFLSAENIINKLQGPARLSVCTRKNIINEVMRVDKNWRHPKLNRPTAKMVSRAIEEAGIKESARSRTVGLYELKELLDEADHFQEWLAEHKELGYKRRIRIYLTHGKSKIESTRLQKAAQLEFKLLKDIDHQSILKAQDYQQHDHGPALIYEYDEDTTRLDHMLLQLGAKKRLDTIQALELLQTIAEAVQFAHEHRLYHRALSPQSIFVKQTSNGKYKIKIANWYTAERTYDTESNQVSILSHLTCLLQEDASPYIALEKQTDNEAEGVLLDIFSLGTIAYHLFTGKKPAENSLELQDRLSGGTGLLITDEVNGTIQELQYLVQYATHPDVISRISSMDEFFDCITLVEDELTRPDNQVNNNPTEAKKDDTFEGGITIKKRLGKGASSIVFLVDHKGQERVLKLADTVEHNDLLRKEGEIIQKLHHQAIIAHHKTVEIAGHTGLLIDRADKGTLSHRLRLKGAIQLEHLERFGDDLLTAMCHLEEKGIMHRDIKPENIGLVEQGNKLHLILFDFSLSSVSSDNYTAGTVAYMDPFIRDKGRRRWDDFAERFSCALTLYEMTSGSLPGWSTTEGLPVLIEGNLKIDHAVFDPTIRDDMSVFFQKALNRKVQDRFANAEDMLRAWRQIFVQASKHTQHPKTKGTKKTCLLEEAQLNTQIGLLELTPQALDTLSRLNINKVSELIKLPRNKLVGMTGVGIETRKELSSIIETLRKRLAPANTEKTIEKQSETHLASVDILYKSIIPKETKRTDLKRQQFLNEYLGRLNDDHPKGKHSVHWPQLVNLSAETGIDTETVRDYQTKALLQWGKKKAITALRNETETLLEEHGGIMTGVELAEAILLRRGSVQASPIRDRWAQAVTRVAIETELSKQSPRWILRRCAKRFLITDNRQEQGQELADYGEALGQLADECAEQQPLLSPIRTLEKINAVPTPDSFIELSNHRLLRLAAAASQNAALSSRAEFYCRGMKAELSLELAQGALLGSQALNVQEVHARIHGRYPEAEKLPGRPQLDNMLKKLEIGFQWNANHQHRNGRKGAYCLPQVGLTSWEFRTRTQYHYSQSGELDITSIQDIEQLEQEIQNVLKSARFLALSVRPKQYHNAKQKLLGSYPLTAISFDELLLRQLQKACSAMSKPPKWEVILKADASETNSRDWQNLMRLVNRVLPAMAEEINKADQAILLTETGLIARYDLVNSWLNDLRQHLITTDGAHGLIMLIATATQKAAAVIDGVTIPKGAGSNEYSHIPSIWLQTSADEDQRALK